MFPNSSIQPLHPGVAAPQYGPSRLDRSKHGMRRVLVGRSALPVPGVIGEHHKRISAREHLLAGKAGKKVL